MSQQARFPEMADGRILELEAAAFEYAKCRDQRQKLTAQEVELKARLLRLMKESGKDSYEYDGVEVELVTVEETVKVKVRKKDYEAESNSQTVRQLDSQAAETDSVILDPHCRLCEAPNPEWQTIDGQFFYCEAHSSNIQEGEQVRRIRDAEKAGALIQQMREADDAEPPRQDPLVEEGAFINARNRGRRKTR
jgi:hypothetical protein